MMNPEYSHTTEEQRSREEKQKMLLRAEQVCEGLERDIIHCIVLGGTIRSFAQQYNLPLLRAEETYESALRKINNFDEENDVQEKPSPAKKIGKQAVQDVAPLPLAIHQEAQNWQQNAYCHPDNPDVQIHPDVFFPSSKDEAAIKMAKDICERFCNVQLECLNYALNNDQSYGVWGGRSEDERRGLKRRGRGLRIRTR